MENTLHTITTTTEGTSIFAEEHEGKANAVATALWILEGKQPEERHYRSQR